MSLNINNINIFSLNCLGTSNKIPIFRDICSTFDLLFLQETWITPDNLNFLDDVHEDFYSHSISAVDLGQPLQGRPYGGVSILLRRSLGLKFCIKLYNDPRLLGIVLESESQKIFILNVYLPYFSVQNYDEYLYYVGKISSIVEEYEHNDVMILGDFNADVNSPFFEEWHELQETADFIFADVERLPVGSYTHVNNGSLSKSWVDHVLVSNTVNRCIDHIEIIYDDFLSDHLPLCISLKFDMLPAQIDSPEPVPNIKWDFYDEVKTSTFFHALSDRIITDPSQFLCHDTHCHINEHKHALKDMWDNFVKTVLFHGKRIFGLRTGRGRVVPGWNDLVRDHYAVSREAFLAWRSDGSPRQGASADYMRRSRARFKLALRQCRASENEARARAVASKFRGKNINAFWSDIKTLNKNRPKLPTTIDGAHGSGNICKLWENHFSQILNSINDDPSATELNS